MLNQYSYKNQQVAIDYVLQRRIALGELLDEESFTDVVKTTIFLANLADFATVNEIYGRHFQSAPPARSTVQAAGLPRGALVEIEVIAQRG